MCSGSFSVFVNLQLFAAYFSNISPTYPDCFEFSFYFLGNNPLSVITSTNLINMICSTIFPVSNVRLINLSFPGSFNTIS